MRSYDPTAARVTERPDAARRHAFYPCPQEPLRAAPLVKLPIGAIEPLGWLRGQLVRLRDGMVGRLAELSPFLMRKGNAWLSARGAGTNAGEEVPYWLRGFGDLGYILDDARIVRETNVWLEGMFRSQQQDGWFGPRNNRETNDLWPNMVALDCLRSRHEATADPRVLDHMARYFRWQLAEKDLLPGGWQKLRGGDNLESVHWLYDRTGEIFLLELAAKLHHRTADWTAGLASPHGVNICQGFRAPAQFWLQSGEPAHLEATYENYRRVMESFGQAPGGMFGADENCRKGRGDPRQGAETCAMVEFLRSFVRLLRITGDPLWADRCEEVAFNSLPAAMTADLKALHYLTAPNQIRLDGENKHPGIDNQNCMFPYSAHRYRCCQHNVAQGWPALAQELWHATADGGLCASFFVRGSVIARVGAGTTVRVDEATDYPFDGRVRFTITAPREIRFPLHLRIPGWCENARVALNGVAALSGAPPGCYVVLERAWRDGDRIELELPMPLRIRTFKRNANSVSVHRGPLAFALRIEEHWRRFEGEEDWPNHEAADRPSTPEWPAWEVHPAAPWNYALVLDQHRPLRVLELVQRREPVAEQPFTLDDAPLTITAPARRIGTWEMDGGLVGRLPPSPVESDAAVEPVTLVPMGCARLRISAFPVCAE
ncbi:MAG: glycoside hydrolase family 127 protein [Planctomycetes bacterium]|nr:glycoside hydrolase family 127 protein [Planctomycetota bacterium]